jgi:hypothetical protein
VTNIAVKHLKNQVISLSVAAILLLSAIGIALPALTPIPAFAPSENTDDDFTTGSANDYEILSFLIDVIECFTVNGEEFSDDVQLCLYDVIEVYFDDDDGNNVNGNDDSLDSDNDNNDTTETDDNNDTTETDDNNDTTETDDNNDTPTQET